MLVPDRPLNDEAFVILVGERYFYGFSRVGRLQTAWSLAGAKLFLREDELQKVEKRLDKKSIRQRSRARVALTRLQA